MPHRTRPRRFKEWSDAARRPRDPLPPGIDDMLGMRGSEHQGDPIATDERAQWRGDRDAEGVDRPTAEESLAGPPTDVLVHAAEERGVGDARTLDRGTLLRRLRERLGEVHHKR